jgi:hypothetical protein
MVPWGEGLLLVVCCFVVVVVVDKRYVISY